MASNPISDEKELLAKLQAGDKNVYGDLYLSYYAPLCHLAEKHVGDAMVAEDLVSGVFLKLWEDRKSFNDMEHVKASLYTRLRNSCLDHLKTTKRATERDALFSEEQYVPVSNYLADITHTEYIAQLYKAIAELPEQVGTIITKTFIEGKSNQETAEELHLSVQTIKNQKSRGLGLLKDKLGEDEFKALIVVAGLFHML